MKRGFSKRNRQHGLSLLEVALALTIASIAVGAAISVVGAQMENARISATKKRIEAIELALMNFALRNGRLPCPARGDLASTDANYGRENRRPPDLNRPQRNRCFVAGSDRWGRYPSVTVRGVVPWKDLGLTRDGAVDGYGRFFTYVIPETQAYTVNASDLSGTLDIQENTTTQTDVAVAVILSHGSNGLGAYTPLTTRRMPMPGRGTLEEENTDRGDDVFLVHEYVADSSDPFDDIVRPLTTAMFQARLAELSGGDSNDTLNELNATFDGIKNALIAYMARDNADPDGGGARTVHRRLPFADRNGRSCNAAGARNDGVANNNCLVGNVPWQDVELTQAQVTDPWGTLIQYTVEQVVAESTATSGLTFSQPAADTDVILLTSYGPDRVSGTADDISLGLNAAQLQGIFISAAISLDP